MKKYVIVTDSCSDLNRELREKYDIDYIPMHVSCEGKDYEANLDWEVISIKEYFDLMRAGKRITTAQITANQYKEAFTKYLADGYDILSISCSSALSASVATSRTVAEELKAEYPDAKIFCVDSLSACAGLGILGIVASKMRAEGKTIEEVVAWLEENKLTANQEATAESLKYLKQAGRVSAAAAFFGGILQVKPIIISDATGMNFSIEKVKGRAKSITRLAERMKEEYEESPYQTVIVEHADCPEGAEQLISEIKKLLPDVKIDYTINFGPIISASVGPGTIGVFFVGKKVTANAPEA